MACGVFIAALVCAMGAAMVRHPFGTVLVITVVAGCVVWMSRRHKARLQAIAAMREGESICGFARSFDLRSTDPLVVRSVYEQIQHELHGIRAGFPVRASDRFGKELEIDDDTLDIALVPAIARRTGRCLDGTQANPCYGRVRTVSDLVQFFNHQPERSQGLPTAAAPRCPAAGRSARP
jgi:hypothetical protein